MDKNIFDIFANTTIGLMGFSVTLSNVNIMVSIMVGLATAFYLFAKVYFLFKNKGK